MFLSDSIQAKVGAATSAVTTLTGLSTFLEIINPLLGVIASAVGICLSIVFIYNAIKKNQREERLLELEEIEHSKQYQELKSTVKELKSKLDRINDSDKRSGD